MTANDLLKRTMYDNGLYCEDGQDVLNAVRDLFEALADDCRERYPYATNTISKYEKTAAEISCLCLDDDL